MDKPLCKICKERHYGLCDAFAAKVGSSPAKPASPQPRAKAMRPQVPDKERANVERSFTPLSKAGEGDQGPNGKFDRLKYQREFMQKKRARLKAEREAAK